MTRACAVGRRVGMIAAALSLLVVSAASARAQYVTYYAPSPFVQTVAYAPVAAPMVQTVGYAPMAPMAYAVASPVVAAPAPVVATPAPAIPVITYYRPPVVQYSAVPTVVSRYRPILGGTVSRVRYSYMPVVY